MTSLSPAQASLRGTSLCAEYLSTTETTSELPQLSMATAMEPVQSRLTRHLKPGSAAALSIYQTVSGTEPNFAPGRQV